MLSGFINRVSSAASLKDALDVSSARTRSIADRVAKASLGNGDGFSLPSDPSQPGNAAQTAPGGVDIEGEMVGLADEQLRYEATARLLAKTYESIRLSIRGSR